MSESPPIDLSLDHDVIVVGAGLSGLTAARELKRRAPELRVLVVEAKNRVGGRTLTVEMKTNKNKMEKFDLGGQWVGRTQNNILDVLEELHIPCFDQWVDGAKWAQMGVSQPRKYNTSLPIKSIRQFTFTELFDFFISFLKYERLARKMNLRNLFSWKEAVNYDDTSVSKWCRANCWRRATNDGIDIALRAVYGAPSDRISMLYSLVYARSAGSFANLLEATGDGAQALRVKGGTQQICTRIVEELGRNSLLLNSAIELIEVDEATATSILHLYSTGTDAGVKTLRCSRVILAIPPSECDKVRFSPEVPYMKRRLFQSMPPGHLLKFVITYETAFWREAGYSGEIISTGRTIIPGEVLPLVVVYDATSSDGVPALVGFVNEEFSDMPKAERCNHIVKDLMRFLGEKAMNEFVDYADKVWLHEPFNGGCPTGIMAPGNMDAFQVIREPYQTVHFAGTETAVEWMGYMSGAVESGLRTAHEVLHVLEKHQQVSYTYLKGSIFDSDYMPALAPSNFYREYRSPWWRRLFFASVLCAGIFAYSKKYELSYTAKAVKPIENTLIRWFTGIEWPT